MFSRAALRRVGSVVGLVLVAAGLAAAVRLLPWVLDPKLPGQVALPFARGLLAVAVEAALLVGWPVGWALAAHRLVEQGEALALQSLGQRPLRTLATLAPQGIALAALLGAASLVGGRDAREPGRVVNELLAQGRGACDGLEVPAAFTVPFSGTTWLCRPDAPPRLVGKAPGSLSRAFFSAEAARVSGDLREIRLDDAHVALVPSSASSPLAVVHVGTMSLRGLSPWAQASTLPSWMRALWLALAGALAAVLSSHAALIRGPMPRGRLHAILVGAVGPLAALATLRFLERTDAAAGAYAAIPLASALVVLAASSLAREFQGRLLRLPRVGRAATK